LNIFDYKILLGSLAFLS